MDIRRGIIWAFDSGTYLADVQIVGSMATMLTGVPVARQIGADLLTSGTKCGVLFFDETNPSDACVVFVYGGAPTYALRSERLVITSVLTLTTSWQDVPGCTKTFTPPVACRAVVIIVPHLLSETGADVGIMQARLNVDGVGEDKYAEARFVDAWDRYTVAQTYVKQLSATQHTLKMQARKTDAGGTARCYIQTTMTIFLLPDVGL